MAGLTPTGFELKTSDEILSEIAADQRANISPLWSGRTLGIIGACNASVASQLGSVWQALGAVHAQFDRRSAEGAALDSVGELTGTSRLPRRRTVVQASITLDGATAVASGDLIASVAGAPSRKFRNTYAFTSGGTPGSPHTQTVQFECTEFGPVEVPPGTLTIRETSVAGWSAVTNPDPGTIGADVETDSDYRLRQEADIAASGSASQPALVSALREVPGVVSVTVLGNDTDATVSAVPPHSFEAILEGGDDGEIAAVIFAEKTVGDGTSGSTVRTVRSPDGLDFQVRFTRPGSVNMHVAISIRTTSDYPGDTTFKAALVSWANLFHTPGADVSPSRVGSQAFATPGVYDVVSCTVGTTFPGGTAMVPVDVRSRAVFASARITVTVVP